MTSISRRTFAGALASLPLALSHCARERTGSSGRTRIVLRHQPMWARSSLFEQRLRSFERRNPGIEVHTQLVPNSSDLLHQYYLTALEGSAEAFDLFVADVVWIPEFARAGWIADLSPWFAPGDVRRMFLGSAADAVIVDDKTYALPWYLDVGVLYMRRDLVAEPPRSIDALHDVIDRHRARDAAMQGLLFQGRQSEGLVCVGYEAMWAFGAAAGGRNASRVTVDGASARRGLGWLRELVERGRSPASVLSSGEEDSRRAFQSGGALFMRNWPYAWPLLQAPDSPVRDKVAVIPFATIDGTPGHGTLGGWQLVMNARIAAHKRDAAIALLRELTTPEASVDLALGYGRSPARVEAYADPRLREGAPFLASLAPHFERARSRPASPYYNLFADTLQSEFSAVVTGVRTADVALREAQAAIDRWVGA